MRAETQKAIWLKRAAHCAGATAGVALLTWIIAKFHFDASPASVPIVYLLVVMLSALLSGRVAAVWASVCSFLAFNWFFVAPRYAFTVQDPTEWIALCMFLLTAIVIGQLTALLKARASEARQHQRETAALSEASWAIASKLDVNSALNEVVKQIARVVELEAAAIILSKNGLQTIAALYQHDLDQPVTAIEALESKTPIADGGMILPIEMNDASFGSLVIRLRDGNQLTPAQERTVKSLVNHAAVILQRDDLMHIQATATAFADADRLKTALLSMVSHDFRSPLTSIKAFASTLLSEGSPLDHDTQRGLYQGIEQEADRLNRMVGNILDLSRLEAGAWKPKFETVQIAELIGMVLDPFSADDNRRITVKLDERLIDVYVDPVQMVQVLKNLVENALKYSPAESTVEIETRLEESEVRIKVLDRGRGLSEQELPHIFDPFFRGAGLQESTVPGVGIGLAVCQGLVNSHGGNLIAEMRLGGGAVFSVRLPLHQREEQPRSIPLCES